MAPGITLGSTPSAAFIENPIQDHLKNGSHPFKDFLSSTPEQLASQLTDLEKASLLAGRDWWHTVSNERIGLPSITMSDGPNGIRGNSHLVSTPAQCIPCATALGATWNVDTMQRVGAFLAMEAIAKRASLVLGPTVNLPRSPLGGRVFEQFGEDPFHSGILSAAYINGMQDHGIGATLKHLVANDMEHERDAVNANMDERTLREVYLKPFEIAQKLAKPWAYMTAKNRIEGVHCSENLRLLQNIVRDEWKSDAFFMSDWYAVYSVSESINAGLDLEMPGPAYWRAPETIIKKAIHARKILPQTLHERAKTMIHFAQKACRAHPEIIGDVAEEIRDNPQDRLDNRSFARESIVLLKNERNLLPLNVEKLRSVAIIGPNAKTQVISGGGSAALSASYVVTPFAGLTSALPDHVQVRFEMGCHSHQNLPLMTGKLRVGPNTTDKFGFITRFYNGARSDIATETMVTEMHFDESLVRFNDTFPPGLNIDDFAAESIGYFTPEDTATFQFGMTSVGRSKLYVDNQLIVNDWDFQEPGTQFYGKGSKETVGEVFLEAGQTYQVRVVYSSERLPHMAKLVGICLMTAAFRFGCVEKLDAELAIKQAAKTASEVDVTLLVIGTNHEWETEGTDRADLELPLLTNKLVEAVAKSTKNLVVINQTGSPVTMPWLDQVPSLLQIWFQGNECGNAVADIVFGKHNPSGRLPLTFPHRVEDTPPFGHYSSQNGEVRYSEGLFMGYKWYEARKIQPLFPMGFGLSYTSFHYSDLVIGSRPPQSWSEDSRIPIQFRITNTGNREGDEVAQVYVSDVESSLTRPKSELKGFAKVNLASKESKTVTILLDRTSFAFFDDQSKRWTLEPGLFRIRVARNAAESVLEQEITLEAGHSWAL